jgi:hypothetical protein
MLEIHDAERVRIKVEERALSLGCQLPLALREEENFFLFLAQI